MTLEELRAKKQELYETAGKDGSIDACLIVGRMLGRPISNRYGPKRQWEQSGVSVYVDDYGNYMTVHHNGKLVCSTHSTNELFVPGEWMTVVRGAEEAAELEYSRLSAELVTKETQKLSAELGLS